MQHFKQIVKDLHKSLEPELDNLKSVITSYIGSDVNLINEIQAFLSSHPGKLLRPTLTILSAKLFNYKGDNHIKLAAAIECIHAATLLHDDVIDNSEIRHNQPTINLMWNNKSAILMGDYLFSKAFQLMVSTKKLEVLEILSLSSAVISKGELHQLENIGNINLNENDYINIITAKTAYLFQAATHVGALIATNNKKEINLLKELGLNFGLAYQILDDINDYTLKESTIGKNPGDDLREGKLTLPLILALKKMNLQEKVIVEEIIAKEIKTNEDLNKILLLLNKYNSLEESKKLAKKYITQAINRLNLINDSSAKENLISLVKAVV